MSDMRNVIVFGSAGGFCAPITTALIKAGLSVTIISRFESTLPVPPGALFLKAQYTFDRLVPMLHGADAVVSILGPVSFSMQNTMIEAAVAAGVKRFILGDLKRLARDNPKFTFTRIATGVPIDWALNQFVLMGFDVRNRRAVIYDEGTGEFTGTTLEGIGQSVVGVLQNLDETANRFLKVRSIQTNQNQLLEAFQVVTGQEWKVKHSKSKDLFRSARQRFTSGVKGWILDLLIYHLYGPGEPCCIISSREESDSDLLKVKEETPQEVTAKVVESTKDMPKWGKFVS
ncbi:NAD(P)-binding protein [Daldinia bambusicola]|nr:NAD(P)-binding protein [Daldinia bambusicola]